MSISTFSCVSTTEDSSDEFSKSTLDSDVSNTSVMFDNLELVARNATLDEFFETKLSPECNDCPQAESALTEMRQFLNGNLENAVGAARFERAASRIAFSMRRWASCERVMEEACHVLAQLSSVSLSFCHSMGQSQALDAVALAMMRHPNNVHLHCHACSAVQNAARVNQEMALSFMDVWKGHLSLIMVLRNEHFVAHETLQLLACRALQSCAEWKACRKALARAGACKVLQAVAGNAENGEKVQGVAQETLYQLTGSNKSLRKVVLNKTTQVEKLLQQLSKNSGNCSSEQEIQQAVESLDKALQGDDAQAFENRALVTKSQGGKIMATTLHTYKSNADIVWCCCRILAQLARSSADFRQGMQADGVLEAVVTTTLSQDELQYHGLTVLIQAARDKENAMRLIQAPLDIHKRAVELLQGNDQAVLSKTCELLLQLVQWDECMNGIAEDIAPALHNVQDDNKSRTNSATTAIQYCMA